MTLKYFIQIEWLQEFLGMGDVLSLIEKAQEAIDEKEAKELSQKMLENDFTLKII